MEDEKRFYRVTLREGLEVDVVRLDVALVDNSLARSNLPKQRKRWLRQLFIDAVRRGRFKLMDGDIHEMGHRS